MVPCTQSPVRHACQASRKECVKTTSSCCRRTSGDGGGPGGETEGLVGSGDVWHQSVSPVPSHLDHETCGDIERRTACVLARLAVLRHQARIHVHEAGAARVHRVPVLCFPSFCLGSSDQQIESGMWPLVLQCFWVRRSSHLVPEPNRFAGA